LAARPRGGDWLDDEIASWRPEGIDTVFSLLMPEEEVDLDLAAEEATSLSSGLRFFRLPIPDRQVPADEGHLSQALEKLAAELTERLNVVLHCRQGIGRTGLVAACLFIKNGVSPDAAVRQLSAVRGVDVPETPEQRRWIDRYADTIAAAAFHG
jgi:protein-tyrosine phosphatase